MSIFHWLCYWINNKYHSIALTLKLKGTQLQIDYSTHQPNLLNLKIDCNNPKKSLELCGNKYNIFLINMCQSSIQTINL